MNAVRLEKENTRKEKNQRLDVCLARPRPF